MHVYKPHRQLLVKIQPVNDNLIKFSFFNIMWSYTVVLHAYNKPWFAISDIGTLDLLNQYKTDTQRWLYRA